MHIKSRKEIEREYSIEKLCSDGWTVSENNLLENKQRTVSLNLSTPWKISVEAKEPLHRAGALINDMLLHLQSSRRQKGELDVKVFNELFEAFKGKIKRAPGVGSYSNVLICEDRFDLILRPTECRFKALEDCRPEDYGMVRYILRDEYEDEEFKLVSRSTRPHKDLLIL